jgi:hypothetical protein
MTRQRCSFVLLVSFFAACGGANESGSSGGLEVVREYVGDTLVVRTVTGSAWGGNARLVPEVSIGELEGDLEYLFGNIRSLAVASDGTIYVVDAQVPELRAFSAEGVFQAILGRPGEGPGEIKQPDGGLAVLSDGRVLVRDPGNARIQVYGPDGTSLDTWPIRGGFNSSSPFFQTDADEVHTLILLDPGADVLDWKMGLVRIGPDGTPGDTLVPPDVGYEAPRLEARHEEGDDRSVSVNSVPFSAGEDWAIHPGGCFVHGLSTEYRIDLLKPTGPVRIERDYEPVPVTRGEKSEEEARTTHNMRFTEPGWRWNGPPIPDVKPPFRDIFVGRDGRIWVQVHQAAVEVEDPDYDPTDPDSVEDRWREPVAFDVFREDGTYEGRVTTDLGFGLYPTPVFGETHVWATTTDDLGVQRVVRFRIEVDSVESAS